MKVVGLLSGGKDSCFNLVHCIQNGHEIVALASLRPPIGKEEIDSYMYQTVGQDAIEVVAAALDRPLIRRVIAGTAVEQSSEYGHRNSPGSIPGDETEDMYELLKSVKEKYPEVEGVSVGAILSNYQRVRVEHVCRRLGLNPLAYLWQRDQEELLSDMISAGLEAVLIKVAGIGLTDNHLGKSLAQMQPLLRKLNKQYGAHICGEGGEYETLTLDCPLYKSKIVLVETEIVIQDESNVGMVAYLRIKQARLEHKLPTICEAIVPPTLDEKYREILDAVGQKVQPTGKNQYSFSTQPPPVEAQSRKKGRWVGISGVRPIQTTQGHTELEEEVRDCFAQIEGRLTEEGLKLTEISHINVYISDMSTFARVNAVYGTYFGTSPPTRACIAVDHPVGTSITMDCIAYAEEVSSVRQALHVQGISYWAAANIGPYSQAVAVGGELFVSGQIGLIPSSMQLPSPPSLAMESALALQHLDRITELMKTNSGKPWAPLAQCALIWTAGQEYFDSARTAWTQYIEPIHYGLPVLFVACKTIPKGGCIEVQMLQHTGLAFVEDEETGMVFEEDATPDSSVVEGANWLINSVQTLDLCVSLVVTRGDITGNSSLPPHLRDVLKDAISVRLLYTPDTTYWDFWASCLKDIPWSPIPCRALVTQDKAWDTALVIQAVSSQGKI